MLRRDVESVFLSVVTDISNITLVFLSTFRNSIFLFVEDLITNFHGMCLYTRALWLIDVPNEVNPERKAKKLVLPFLIVVTVVSNKMWVFLEL